MVACGLTVKISRDPLRASESRSWEDVRLTVSATALRHTYRGSRSEWRAERYGSRGQMQRLPRGLVPADGNCETGSTTVLLGPPSG